MNQLKEPSQEERMLRKLGNDMNEIVKTIFGTGCRLELNITGAPVSKVALMQECKTNAQAVKHQVQITADGKYCINVCDANYLPF